MISHKITLTMIFLVIIKRNSDKAKQLNAKTAICSWGSDVTA